QEGATLLERIILTPGSDSAERWKPLAIRALGAMRYSRALPALDTLIGVRSESPFAKDLRTQFSIVLGRMADSARFSLNPDSAARNLVARLAEVKVNNPALAEVVRRFRDSVTTAR